MMENMAEVDDYTTRLESAVEARGEYVQSQVLPKLKDQFRAMRSSFEALFTLLKKKGLIKEDPYRYEERLSELDTPPDDPYLDSERDTALSERLTKFQSRLEYLTDYYDFSLENVSLKRLKALVQFTKFINWRNFSETATQPTTRGFAEQALKVKRGADPLSANIVKDAQEQLDRVSGTILQYLKEITAWYREWYKLQVRLHIFSAPGVSSTPSPEQEENAIKRIKSYLPKVMPGQPLAKDLLLELFAENRPDGTAARELVLSSMNLPAAAPKKESRGPDLKGILLDAARALGACSRSMEEAAQKLSDNALVLESRKLTLAETLRKIWEHMRGHEETGHTYTVDYLEESTSTRKFEEIHLEEFLAGVRKRARLYGGIMAKGGAPWKKLQESSEEGILTFLQKDIQEASETVRRFESLETYFKTEVPREQRSQLRGINVELVTIRENIARARKKSHEYGAKYEEIQQLKKLGITGY